MLVTMMVTSLYPGTCIATNSWYRYSYKLSDLPYHWYWYSYKLNNYATTVQLY